ncbi:MAG: AraC family transcriptional regulator [Cyclobacteriaceae bacterium]
MKFSSVVEFLAEDECLNDSAENTVVKFSPSDLVNDTYKSNHSIKFAKNGYEEYEIDGKYEKLRTAETMLVNGGRDVIARSCGEAVAIFLEDELISEVAQALRSREVENADVLGAKSIQRIDARNFQSVWYKLYEDQQVILTEEFYYEVGAIYVTSFIGNSGVNGVSLFKSQLAKAENIDKLQVAKTFVFDNIDTKVSLEEIAREAAMSKFHLLRNFKHFYGTTPLRLHTWLRLNRAKALLKSDCHNVSDVAHLMDYPDLATFSKQFKQQNGMPPSCYVRNTN